MSMYLRGWHLCGARLLALSVLLGACAGEPLDELGAPPPLAAKVGDASQAAPKECASIREAAEVERGKTDIVWVIDTSPSMVDEIQKVQANISGFMREFEKSNADTRAVMITAPDPAVGTPLARDAQRYRFVLSPVGSRELYTVAQGTFGAYGDFLRKDAVTHFVMVTDDNDRVPAESFRAQMEQRLGRKFIQHAIASESVNGRPCRTTDACPAGGLGGLGGVLGGIGGLLPGGGGVLPGGGLPGGGSPRGGLPGGGLPGGGLTGGGLTGGGLTGGGLTGGGLLGGGLLGGGLIPGVCGGAAAVGETYNALADATKGEKISICSSDWNEVFRRLREAVISSAPLPCDYAIPQVNTITFDPSLVAAVYTTSDGDERELPKARAKDQCGDQLAWHYDDEVMPERIVLCPAACALTERADRSTSHSAARPSSRSERGIHAATAGESAQRDQPLRDGPATNRAHVPEPGREPS